MPSIPTFIVAVSLFLFSANGQTQVTQEEAAQIVSMHNAARSAVSPSASNMMSMSWDAQLAASAQAYANTCPSGHSGTKGVGENLSWGWPSIDVTKAISMWTDEKPYYTYASNSCQPGQQCGHYTQMVWATSTKVGCGKQTCANLMGHGKGVSWVCRYSPAGNYVGQLPYKTGAPCSQCPTGFSCSQNMCSGSAAAQPISSAPSSPVLPANNPAAPSSSGTVVIPVIQTPQGPMVPVVVTSPSGYRGRARPSLPVSLPPHRA